MARTTNASCAVSSKACMAGADDRPSCWAATSPNARDVLSPGNCGCGARVSHYLCNHIQRFTDARHPTRTSHTDDSRIAARTSHTDDSRIAEGRN